ncbi:MAG: hypothetical protein WCO84_01510 [bacterium]
MDKYKLLEKFFGTKNCPQCGKILDLSNNSAFCVCGFEDELIYKDKTRDRTKKTRKDYVKLGITKD